MVSNSISTATTTTKPIYIGFYGAVDPNVQEQEPVNYSISKLRNEFSSINNDKRVNFSQLTINSIDKKTRNTVNVKSNNLLTDPINRQNNCSDINTGDIGLTYLSSSNHGCDNDRSSGAIRVNSQSREHNSPLIATTALKLSTKLPRTVSSTTTLKALHGIESKSPLNVRLVRSTSRPKRTNCISGIISKKKSDNMGPFDSGMENINSTDLNNDFTRLKSLLVSNASVIDMNSERGVSKSSKTSDIIGNGLTMSGLSIHRINSQCNRDVNRITNSNSNTLEISHTNINNIGGKGVQIMGMDHLKDCGINKGSMKCETINDLNNSGYITNKEIIKMEERSNNHCSSSGMSNNISTSSCSKSLLQVSSLCDDNSSSGRYEKLSPVISIIPVGTSINMTTNDSIVPKKGNRINIVECNISNEEHGHEQKMNPLQLTTNSVTITQLQPDTKNTALHSPQPNQLYNQHIKGVSPYEEDDIIKPVMIVGPMDSVNRGVDSPLYTGEQKPSFGNPVTITPVSNNFLDTLLDDPHPLSLFSTVAANQEYLPTSTITANSSTHTIASIRNASAKIRNVNLSDLSEHRTSSDIGRLITIASNDDSLFSEYMEHSEALSLSPPPAGMQRRPKVSYKNLTEGEKNHRLRMLNNEASRLYRHRKQRTIKNLEFEEQQLREMNSRLRVEFESLQLKRNQAMKMLHESLQCCRDCNTRQTVQSGPCSHRHTNTPSKIVTVDTKTQLNWSSKINMKISKVCEIKSKKTIDLHTHSSC